MNPNIAQAIILSSALRLYARTAARITGQMFHSRAYLQAADALTAWAEAQAPQPA